MPTFKISEETHRELEKFKGYLRKQEYTEPSINQYCTYLSRFLRHAGLPQPNILKEIINTFLESEKVNKPQTFKSCRAALIQYFKMTDGGSLKNSSVTTLAPELAELLRRFREHSLEVKHIRVATIESEIRHVRSFLEYSLSHNTRGFANGLTAEDIRGFVVERLATLSDSSKGRIITSIRNFFRCQVFHGQPVHPSIFKLPLSPAVWKRSAFPVTIDISIFNMLHMIPDRNTPAGKRNRCIILCFTELALRCSEVAALTLDNFNWHDGYVVVQNTKNGSERALPLPAMMGNALIEYLMQARPQTSSRTLFVRFCHQRGEPMGCSQIRDVIRKICAKAGLERNACGTHILRRTAATKLYNSGNSLKLVADILGHESLDSTTHYAKADIGMLLSVASPWPGGEHNVG